MRLFGSSNIQYRVDKYFRSLGSLKGKTAIDLFAGKGDSTKVILEMGAKVEAYDLFPEFFDVEGNICQKADIANGLPIEDAHVDIALFQEGIEHVPNQLDAMRELNRVLKPGATLILTTPNISHLRAKFSNLLVEHEIYNRMPISELDAVWYTGESGMDLYYGHMFLIGIQRLRVLGKLTGFDIVKVHATAISRSSLLLGVFLYPLILVVNLFAFWRSVKSSKSVERRWKKAVYSEVLMLNLNPKILFGKHLFMELRKTKELRDISPDFFMKFNHTSTTEVSKQRPVATTPTAEKQNPCDPISDVSG